MMSVSQDCMGHGARSNSFDIIRIYQLTDCSVDNDAAVFLQDRKTLPLLYMENLIEKHSHRKYLQYVIIYDIV